MTSKTSKTHIIHITAREFRDLVTPVLPLAAKDKYDPPALKSVQFRTSSQYLIASTTDRFRMGVKRVSLGELPAGLSAVVSTASVRSILAIFKATKQADPDLALTFTGDRLTVQTLGMDLGQAAFTGEITYPLAVGDYPPLHTLITTALDNAPSDEPVGINPSLLADFRHAQTHGEPMVVRTHGAGKAVVVLIGDNFIGLIQPVRRGDERAMFSIDEAWTEALADAPSKAAKKVEVA